MMNEDVVICIPSRRKPPLRSLTSFDTTPFPILIVADPEYVQIHSDFYKDRSDITVVEGGRGNGPQCAACYRAAAIAGYPLFFKMDDDLLPNTFVTSDGIIPLTIAIRVARECLDVTKTTHAGFCNTSRKDWLGDGYGRTYGLIHGGGNIGISALDPSPYIDERLVRGEDVYRSCAHRERDGAVGRVKFVGFDKRGSADTSVDSSSRSIKQEDFDRTKEIILSRFPRMVTCNGTRTVNGMEIPNWRLKR